MKQRYAIALLLLALSGATAATDEALEQLVRGAVTAGQLQSLCRAWPGDSACTFYIAGIANLVMLPGIAKSLEFCLPKKITMDQLRGNIEGLMRNAPTEMLEYSAAFAVIAGLRMNYPCAGSE